MFTSWPKTCKVRPAPGHFICQQQRPKYKASHVSPLKSEFLFKNDSVNTWLWRSAIFFCAIYITNTALPLTQELWNVQLSLSLQVPNISSESLSIVTYDSSSFNWISQILQTLSGFSSTDTSFLVLLLPGKRIIQECRVLPLHSIHHVHVFRSSGKNTTSAHFGTVEKCTQIAPTMPRDLKLAVFQPCSETVRPKSPC